MSIEVHQTQQLAEIAARLAECEEGVAHKLEDDSIQSSPPIQQAAVVELIAKLRTIIFPEITKGNSHDNKDVVEAELIEVNLQLCSMITQISNSPNSGSGKQLEPETISIEYLSKLPSIRDSLATDVQAAYDGDPACKSTAEVILCYPGLLAVTVYRLAHELYLLNVPLIPRMMTEWAHGETGIDIHPGSQIGNYFFIDHGTGVVIGETCKIGDYVKVYQGVTLGALSFSQDERGQLVRNIKRHPTIEDRVVIYANATVLGGNTTVGHDSVVGSSVWLTESVCPFTTVIMEKPKLRLRSEKPSEFEPPLDFQI